MRGGISGVNQISPEHFMLPASLGPLLLMVLFVLIFFAPKLIKGFIRLQITSFPRLYGYEMPADQKFVAAVVAYVLITSIVVVLLVISIFLMSGTNLYI